MKEYSRQGEREVILERKQAILIFTIVMVLILGSFVVGGLFGKNLADRKLAKEQADKAQKGFSPEGPKPILGTTVKELPSSTVLQTAKAPGSEGSKIMEKINQQQPPPQLTSPAKGATAKPKAAEAAATAAKKPAEEKKPEAPKPAIPGIKSAVPPAKPAPPKGNFAIQVASFPDKTSADDLVKKLAANKWDAYSIPTEIPGKGTYYRVYVGRYSTKDQVDKAIVIFKSKEPDHKDAFIRKLE